MAPLTTLLLALLPFSQAATLQKLNITLPNNPTNVGFYIYIPDTLAPHPPILVNPHWCHGDAPAAHRAGGNASYASFADKHGFLVIYPNSPNDADDCWDVSSRETLTYEGGGDSLGIVSMVRWALKEYKADEKRVFVTGVSSGAMMTSVLIGAYPDVFAAGSAFSGVPFGCFEAPGNSSGQYDYWNSECAEGRVSKSGAEWAGLVRRATSSGDGNFYRWWRPKMQIWHGTKDEVLSYKLFGEEVKQWNAVFGYSDVPTAVVSDVPRANWTKSVYDDDGWFEAYSAGGVPHNIPVQFERAVKWFDLDCDARVKECFSWGRGGPSLPNPRPDGCVPGPLSPCGWMSG